MPSSILPVSVVSVVNTSGPCPPMLISPTDDSGFEFVLALKIRLTASACASNREGLLVMNQHGKALIKSASFNIARMNFATKR